jgi:hypothetical protein
MWMKLLCHLATKGEKWILISGGETVAKDHHAHLISHHQHHHHQHLGGTTRNTLQVQLLTTKPNNGERLRVASAHQIAHQEARVPSLHY